MNKVYKEVYKKLPHMIFTVDFDTCIVQSIDGEHFIWHINSNQFQLKIGKYLEFDILNPYRLYWWFKYVRWCKKYIVNYKPERKK